jgi:hypothetical protein
MTAVAALVVMFAAGCDSRVDVRGPRIVLPTVPTSPIDPAGSLITETRPIAGVSGVVLDSVGHVEITVGGTESLTITAPESIIDQLTSEVVGGRLILDRTFESYRGQASDIQYDVAVRQLDELSMAGVGLLAAEGVDTGTLRVDHAGVGELRVVGRADRQEVALSGVGGYVAEGLETRVTRIEMTSGSAVVWATERIEGRVAFGCTLEYHGNPVVDVVGGGIVRKIGLGS